MAKEAVEVLMRRDDISREEAEEMVASAREEMLEAIELGDYDLAEDILYCDLGLELDYIFDFL